MRKYKDYGDLREKVRENKEYYELRGRGEKIQRVLWFERKGWERDKEYYELRVTGERKKKLWFERKKLRENKE